jgi:hypothetical protein
VSRKIAGPFDPQEMQRFLDSLLYEEEAFLIDEVTRLEPGERLVEARMDTARPLPYSALQRSSETHPAHVAASDLLMLTGNLGFLHAWFFHGCRWDEGWAGFGNRIHRADFKALARIGPPLQLESRETRTRVGPKRVVMRMEFQFRQGPALVYRGDQSAIFVRDRALSSPLPD